MPETAPVPDDQTPVQTDDEVYVEAERLYNDERYSDSVQLLQSLIDRDDPFPDAFNLMGNLYAEGLGIEQNDEMALYFYQRAHDLGVREATFNLACFYWHGVGTEKNLLKAIELFTNCAERGDPEVNLLLGEIYDPKLNSDKSIADRQRAIEHYTFAASHGYYDAQYNLAALFNQDGNQQEAGFFASKALLHPEATAEEKTKAAKLLKVILQDDVDTHGGESKLAIAFAQSIMASARGWVSVPQHSIEQQPASRNDSPIL